MLATAGGATAREISLSRFSGGPVKSFGWLARRGEILLQLESGSERDIVRLLRSLSRDFSGDDFINKLMKPLTLRLRADERAGSTRRLIRFNQMVEHHSLVVGRASLQKSCIPLLLETAPDADEISVLLKVIRLTGQGFCVDTFENSTGTLSETFIRCYDHHLLWSTDGKLQVKLTCVEP